MSELQTLPAPVLDSGTPPDDKWSREQRAYRRLLPTLLQTHKEKYVAIHNESVVDADPDLIALGRRVYQRFGYILIYMDFVTDHPAVVRVPHYRVIAQG